MTTARISRQNPLLLLADGGEGPRFVFEARRKELPLIARSYEQLELGKALPRCSGVLARFIKDGSLEEITFRLSLLHALERRGVRVMNPPRVIERAVDKGLTAFLLDEGGIPTPPAWTYGSYRKALAKTEQEIKNGNKLVLKPLFGNGGRGLLLLEKPQQLRKNAGVWHLQRFIEGGNEDWRVMTLGGRAVASMRRSGRSWVTNIAMGARAEPGAPADARKLAVKAAKAIGADYAGVDIIRSKQGEYSVLEINSIPGFKTLEKSAGVNIAALLLDYLSK